MLGACVQDDEPFAPLVAAHFDENIIAGLGNVDGDSNLSYSS